MPKTRTEFWQQKLRGTVARDKENLALLSSMGWDVYTIWECEIEKDVETALMPLLSRLMYKDGPTSDKL